MLLYIINKVFNCLLFFNSIFGDWGLGIGDWGLGIGPNPPSPIPKRHLNIKKNFDKL